jgi:prepilin-type N-terminal cleavage/methylation domain-containing protein
MMQTPHVKRCRRQDGVTLVELLVGIVLLGIITTMLVGGFFTMQSSYAFTQRMNLARATAREALDRIASELRDCAPLSLTPSVTNTAIKLAGAYEVDFYSSYNQGNASSDGTGKANLRLTRLYLTGSGDYRTLVLQRDTNNNGTFDAPDRSITLATNVVNGSSKVNVPYIFTYGYTDSAGVAQPPAHSVADLSKITWVKVRLLVDGNLNHSPNYIDLTTSVRPRNTGIGL